MRANQIRPLAGTITAVLITLVIAGTYFISTQESTETPAYANLSDEEKLAYLDKQKEERSQHVATERADLYDDGSYCNRISDDDLRQRCLAGITDTGNTTSSSTTRGTRGASTLEPLQNVSSNDERRFNRAELYDDPAYCDEITDDDLKLYCYNELT